MKNLVIIGNGFDLAHGLKTSYRNFIEDLENHSKEYGLNSIEYENNRLLTTLINSKKELWSDIECKYFEILKNFENKNYIANIDLSLGNYNNIFELNQDFEKIKNWLCLYLEKEEDNFTPNENYELFFKSLNRHDSVILNFNYTNTVNHYIDVIDQNIKIIHIHGELNKPENPIIFGYAASNEESRTLLDENDNNYVRNIKKFNYLYTNNEEILKGHLKAREFNLFILGHSCGVSDTLILSQILNSKGIVKIYPFYYKDRNGYFDTMVNIDRIIDDYSKLDDTIQSFQKLVSFPNCHPMPQTEIDNSLSGYLHKILAKQMPSEIQAARISNSF